MNNNRIIRKVTCRILDSMDEGILDARSVVESCLSYMSESDVADMARTNDLLSFDEEDDDTDIDVARYCATEGF